MQSKHWHQIDHVLADKKAKNLINVTKINPTADCFTDHKFLTCKCCILINNKKKKGTKPPSKLDTTMSAERRLNLKRFLDEERRECEESWDDLKEVLQRATKHVFGKKKRKSVDWFED